VVEIRLTQLSFRSIICQRGLSLLEEQMTMLIRSNLIILQNQKPHLHTITHLILFPTFLQ